MHLCSHCTYCRSIALSCCFLVLGEKCAIGNYAVFLGLAFFVVFRLNYCPVALFYFINLLLLFYYRNCGAVLSFVKFHAR